MTSHGGVGLDPHVLYRFYDEDGQLLYVGITRQLGVRWDTHARESAWVRQATRATLEHFDSKTEALVAETAAIVEERPQWNRLHNEAVRPPLPRRPLAATSDGTEMSVSEVAAYLSVSQATVRRYEGKGLLAPAWRLPSGYRRYARIEVEDFKRRADLGEITGREQAT